MLPDTSQSHARRQRLEAVNAEDFAWAVPVMRAGYAGRALVYLSLIHI